MKTLYFSLYRTPRLPSGARIEATVKLCHPQEAYVLLIQQYKNSLTLVAAHPEKEFIGFTSSNIIIKRRVSVTILKSKMVDVVELASTSIVMSFVHYAQDYLRLPQYLGYTSINGRGCGI